MAGRIISLGFKPLRLLRYVKNVSLCFPRSCVPSTHPVSTTFPVHIYVESTTCPRYVICLRIMSSRSTFSTLTLRNTSHVLTLSVQGILNIFPRNQCSAAFKFFVIPWINVHVSHPYSKVDQTYHFSTLIKPPYLCFFRTILSS